MDDAFVTLTPEVFDAFLAELLSVEASAELDPEDACDLIGVCLTAAWEYQRQTAQRQN